MKIDFKVGMVSLVGISGTFPRGHGNYFTINYEGNDAMVVNLSHEDFCDAQSKGLTQGGLECRAIGYNGNYAIYVVDERLPEKARSCWHTYHMAGPHVANLIRNVYDIEDFGCIVKERPELARKVARQTSYDYDSKPGYQIPTITCGCCNKQHTLEPIEYSRPDPIMYKVEISRDSAVFYAPEIPDDIAH